MDREQEIRELVGEWEHGAMPRREFFERALFILGSVTAAEALLAACSPAPAAAPTSPPAATATPVPAAAPTLAPTVAPTRPPQPTPAPTSPTSAVPGFVDPSAVDSAEVTYPNGEVRLLGYLARPKSGGSWPGVIVISETRGLNDHIKDVTRRVANLGYAALGVDALSRQGGTARFAPPANPAQAFNSLKAEEVRSDLVASVAYLKGQAFVKPKIGSVGFCWGGQWSVELATSSKDIAACIIFYGRNPANIDDVQNIAGAVQANYGERDNFINPGIPALEAAMKKYNKPFDPKVYPGAGHSFFNDTGSAYNEAASRDAWARLIEFYKKHLQA